MSETAMPVMDERTLEDLALPEEARGFGNLETDQGHLPLEAMEIDAAVTGLSFRTRLVQTFRNAFGEPLEATYVFPLPDRAAVHGFRLRVGERVVEGVLQERGEARRTYDAALQAGHRAAIAEEDRPGVFTMRAGNIPPGERVEVELELTGPLDVADGQATYRFPLVVAPRYIPGTPLPGEAVGDGTAPDTDAAPDASRITPPVLLPGQPNPVRLSLALTLDPAGLPLGALESSLHEVVREDQEDGTVRVSLEPGTERLNRDFLLRWEIGDGGIRTGLAAQRTEAPEAPTPFALTVVPPTLEESGTRPRDLVIVLDRSGSMSGWKMVAARRAAGRLVDTLTPTDRFAVLLFDDVVEPLDPEGGGAGLHHGTDRNRFRTVERLSAAEARGGTEMSGALQVALERLGEAREGRDSLLVFVTDGQVGNEDQLLWQVRKQARGVRVFAVGVDRAVNEAFLKRLAQPTGGTYALVESEDRLDQTMREVFRRIGSPVLTDLTLSPAAGTEATLDPADLAPAGTVDVFPGVPAVLRGRWTGAPEGPWTIRATLPDGKEWTREVGAHPVDGDLLSRAWARVRLLDLEHEYVTGGRDAAVAERMTALSLAEGVLCRFTAFVAVDREEVVNEGGEGHAVVQPVESPDGWLMPAGGALPPGGPPRPCAPQPMPEPVPCAAPMRSRALSSGGGIGGSLSKLASDAADALGGLFGGGASDEKQRMSFMDCMDLDDHDEGLGEEVAETPEDAGARVLRDALDGASPGAWRALIDTGLADVRAAGDAPTVAATVAYLVTDLEVLVDALRRSSGGRPEVEAMTERLAAILQDLRSLPEEERRRGSSKLGEILDRLEVLDAEIYGEAATDPSASGPPSSGRRTDFWR